MLVADYYLIILLSRFNRSEAEVKMGEEKEGILI